MQPSNKYPLKSALLRQASEISGIDLYLSVMPPEYRMSAEVAILEAEVASKIGECNGCEFVKLTQKVENFDNKHKTVVVVEAICSHLYLGRCIHDDAKTLEFEMAPELIPASKLLPKNPLFGSW